MAAAASHSFVSIASETLQDDVPYQKGKSES